MRRLRAALPRAMLIVALGVATTVAVAWGLALWLPLGLARKHYNSVPAKWPGVPYVEVMEARGPGMVRRAWSAWPPAPTKAWDAMKGLRIDGRYRPVQDRSWGALPAELSGETKPGTGMDDCRGWPWPALWCAVDARAMDSAPGRRAVTGGFWIGGRDSASCRALPLVPRWGNFAADAGVYTAGWAGLLVGVGWARRRARVRRGRCGECGYPLAGGACAECGWGRERG